jgi:hypothetical protein
VVLNECSKSDVIEIYINSIFLLLFYLSVKIKLIPN